MIRIPFFALLLSLLLAPASSAWAQLSIPAICTPEACPTYVQVEEAEYTRLAWKAQYWKELHEMIALCATPPPPVPRNLVPLNPACPREQQFTQCTLDGRTCLTTCKEP